MKQLGVGVVGLGVGEQHARAFGRHPNCRVVSLFDLDESRARRLALDFSECRVVTSLQGMLADPEIDIVSIASFDDAHFEQVIAVLKAGKHVFVEKPVCRTIEELQRIKDVWSSTGGRQKLWSNLVLRAAPLYRWLRERVNSGDLGQIYSFDGDYLYGRLNKITEGWRRDVDFYSVMSGGGIHLLDLMLWLTGERPQKVSAFGNRICSRNTEFRYNDFVSATFEFDSTLLARISANFGCVHKHHHVLRVFGTQGTLLYDDAGARLHTSRSAECVAEPVKFAPLPNAKGDLIPDFVSAILRMTDDGSDSQSFFDGISVCIAADRAVASGNRERIEYV